MKKVAIKKLINNTVETLYPKTSADVVQYDANRTVYSVLADLISRVEEIEENLNIYTEVYATDSSTGETITDSGGSGVILMAASSTLIATENGVAIDDGSGDNVILMHSEHN